MRERTYDILEHLARQGYYEEKNMKARKYGQDIMWFIWSNENSPVYGKAKMATFERYFLDDADLKKEKKTIIINGMKMKQ